MEDKLFELAQSAKIIHPDDWYEQRKVILGVIEDIFNTYPKCYKQQWLCGNSGNKFNLITFKFENKIHFWWDCVIGEVIECSGFERMIGRPQNGKIRTEILWNSDVDDYEPMIPRLPIHFSE
jgi:hypothetical protein